MKIWSLEKLQRIISTINDGEAALAGQAARGNGAASTAGKKKTGTDLSQVLRNEQLKGPADLDFAIATKDFVYFKGPYIYVHDMDEKTKPIIVREYPKVAKKQDGAWPQFRSAPVGKCPFIDEPAKKEPDRQKAPKAEKEKETAVNEKPPANNAETDSKAMKPPERVGEKSVRQDENPAGNQPETMPAPKRVDAPTALPLKPPSPRNAITAQRSVLPTYLGREPAASGVQPSNITSAIRSQMVSSTAAAPGAKAGTSKEVHELKRKVLEKSNGSAPPAMAPPSHRTTEITGNIQPQGPLTRAAKNKAQEKMERIDETGPNEIQDNRPQQTTVSHRRNSSSKKSKEKKRDPKPGYCENCRDKFDDFEEVSTLDEYLPITLFKFYIY